jgi:predicted RNase H-like HicB family nuclease
MSAASRAVAGLPVKNGAAVAARREASMISHRRARRDRSSRKLYTFQIVIEKETEGEGYTAYSPTLQGCFRRAATIEEAKKKIREAVRRRVDSLLADGEPISQCEKLIHIEELSIVLAHRRWRREAVGGR